MIWHLRHRFDPDCCRLADDHYSRKTPGSNQFMPPGRALVLYAQRSPSRRAVWGTSFPIAEYVRHEWAGAWVCSIFRNRRAGLSSALIRDAVAATRFYYGEPPALGMVTFVDSSKVKKKDDPGACFIHAGFRVVGETKRDKLVALQMVPADMPAAEPALGMARELAL